MTHARWYMLVYKGQTRYVRRHFGQLAFNISVYLSHFMSRQIKYQKRQTLVVSVYFFNT